MSAFVTFHYNFSFLVTHILLFTIFPTEHAVEHSKVSSFLIETIVKFINHFPKEIFDSKEDFILKDSIVNSNMYASYLATTQNRHCSYVQITRFVQKVSGLPSYHAQRVFVYKAIFKFGRFCDC